MIRVDLLRSTLAHFVVRCETHVLNIKHGCVVCAAARKMLRLGIDPAEKIDVRRDGEPAFDRCQSVAWWAALTVVETAEHGPRFRRLPPTEPPPSSKAALRASDPPEDKTPVSKPSIPGAGHGRK